ncbi:MAG: aldolase catalytic domain-containing protein [Phycisphaerae bacterium]|jgi:4-hydroxy 2-oxovalerate aldolase|nr:aldolase catalytic domain-containing protein [Phycisphaerae bacterium]MDP7637416.1 aldolase catalytic domain-containing protein [Phycisphaerae bacterium]
MYRSEIKVVDCTIRDGGLVNDSKFAPETVREVYRAICESGVDYVELGYRNSKEMFSPAEFGPWRFCEEKHLRKAMDGIDPRGTKLAVMQDAHKAVPEDVLPKEDSVVDMIRVATYVKDVDKAIRLANNATDKGYEATINIMAISHEGGIFLDESLQQIEEETSVNAVYVVDSFGALYSEEIHFLVEKFQMYLKTKEVGVHCHNSQQLAFANTIEGIIKNANYVDGTLYGLGRGAGNCPLELLLAFLKNPKFNLVPILKAIGQTIMPLRKELAWGYHIPYMLAGVLNQHPGEAIKWMDIPESRRDDYVKFYSQITEDTEE